MTQSLQELEREIEQSRAKLDLTIDRLQDKMTVSGVIDDVLGTARTGRYAPIFDDVLATLRRNPVPVMFMAAGLGMLIYRLGQRPHGTRGPSRMALDQDMFPEPEEARLYGSGASPLEPPQEMFEHRRGTSSRI